MKILLTESFKKQYKKMPKEIQHLFLAKLKLFIDNPDHNSLRIHKLNGILSQFVSLSLNMKYRTKFIVRGNIAEFFEIGTHEQIYKK